MTSTRPQRQKLRSQILSKINTRINKLVTLTPALHKLTRQCKYIAKINYDGTVEVRLYTDASAVRAEPSKRMYVSNKALYAQQSYWGYVEIAKASDDGVEFKCKFVRERSIKNTLTFTPDYLLMVFPINCGGLCSPYDVDQMFQDYREFELT